MRHNTLPHSGGSRSPKRVSVASRGTGCTPSCQLGNVRGVQRLYPMFPSGGPGGGVFLLRSWVASQVALGDTFGGPDEIRWAALAFGAAIALGVFTPLAAVLLIGLELSQMWMSSTWTIGGAGVPVVVTAIALLGPGAYSIDGFRYGRRVLVSVES